MATEHRKRRLTIFVAVLVLLSIGLMHTTNVQAMSEPRYMDCRECGGARKYYLYSGDADTPAAKAEDLLLVLHGFGSSAGRTIAATRGIFEHYAASEGMVVVHAQALGRNWVFGDSGSMGQSYDLAYFDALWNDVRQHHTSLNQIHLVGMSRGAMAAYAIACDGSLPIRSLRVFAMPMPNYSFRNCQTEAPIQFMLANGDEDRLVRYDGGKIHMPWYTFAGDRDFASTQSTEETLAYWRDHNGCQVYPDNKKLLEKKSDGTSVMLRNWKTCTGSTVSHRKVIGGGHRWLNERWNPFAWLLFGLTSREIGTDGVHDAEMSN